jgi:hypothetical protein
VRCGEAEVGVCFIGLGRRWGGGEAAGSGGVFLLVGFEGVKREEETGRRHFSGGSEGGMTALGLALHAWRRAAVGGARHGRRGSGANGSRRWETTPWWAVPGRKAEWSRPVLVGVKER